MFHWTKELCQERWVWTLWCLFNAMFCIGLHPRSTLPQDDPTLVLKKHGGWALGKTAPLLTKKAELPTAVIQINQSTWHRKGNSRKQWQISFRVLGIYQRSLHLYVGVSENSGTSKSSHFNRDFRYFHHPFWGYHYFWKHLYVYQICEKRGWKFPRRINSSCVSQGAP